MRAIDRHTARVDRSVVAARSSVLFVMACGAEGLKFSKPHPIRIVVDGLDMIRDRGDSNEAFLEAFRA
jgi:hypothetical protein